MNRSDLVASAEASAEAGAVDPNLTPPDIIFTAGPGELALSGMRAPKGSIRFRVGEPVEEILTLRGDGQVLVRGEVVHTGRELVDAFAEWLRLAGALQDA